MDQNHKAEELARRLDNEFIRLQPFYYDLRNKIIKPRSVIQETKYFWRRWKPVLGPNLTVLIMELRDRCYYDPKSGEKRDSCWPSLDELANSLGVNERTVRRLLKHPLTEHFIRVEARYRYDKILGKKIRTSNVYHVAMDDPLLPEDEGKLAVLTAEKILEEGFDVQDLRPTGQNVRQVDKDPTSIGQSVHQVVDNLAPTGQNVHHISPDNLSEQKIILSRNTNNVNVSQQSLLEKQEFLVEEILDLCGDKKSLGFYRKVARTCPESMIWETISEVKDLDLTGRIKTSKGATFVDLMKRKSKKRGIHL